MKRFAMPALILPDRRIHRCTSEQAWSMMQYGIPGAGAAAMHHGVGGASLGPVTFVGATSSFTDFTNDITVNKPTGTTTGDLMVLIGNTTLSGASGWNFAGYLWNDLVDEIITSTRQYSGAGYKIAGPSEPSSYTFPGLGNHAAAVLLTFRKADFDVLGGFSGNAVGNVITNPGVALTTANSAVIAYYGSTNSSIDTFSTPSGFTLAQAGGAAAQASLAVFYKLGMPAGSTGSVATTVSPAASGADKRSFLIGLKAV